MHRRRIVLKFGTGILTRKGAAGLLDGAQVRRLATEVAELMEAGHECILVTSGAVGAGLPVLGLGRRPTELDMIQACAAVGQPRLMSLYERSFAGHGLHVGQLLLTYRDIDSRTRYRNARTTIERLLSTRCVVPIINENDTVAVEEIRPGLHDRFGDNDRLSAEVALLVEADLLVILTGVDGLLERRGGRERLVENVRDIDAARALVDDDVGSLSVGGMASKLDAAAIARRGRIPTVIANGRRPGEIGRVVSAERAGTRIHVEQGPGACSRKARRTR